MATAAAPATEKRPVPWIGVAALVAATGSGMVFFLLGRAPPAYVMLNGFALLLGLALVAGFPAGRMAGPAAPWAMLLGVVGIAATLLSGFDLEGVRRWVPLGPVRLHAGMLFIPAVAVLMSRVSGVCALAAMIALATVIILQPDLASALALAAGVLASRSIPGDGRIAGPGALVSALAIVGAWARPDPLAPVPFVEHVVSDAFATSSLLGGVIATALAFACAAPLLERADNREGARALAGTMTGFTLASAVGAFPVPLAGYGASSILGYALALAMLRVPIVPSRAG